VTKRVLVTHLNARHSSVLILGLLLYQFFVIIPPKKRIFAPKGPKTLFSFINHEKDSNNNNAHSHIVIDMEIGQLRKTCLNKVLFFIEVVNNVLLNQLLGF
jgi:hypothetical protein